MRLPGAWIILCQAVIYEMHLRDLTKSPTSGVDESLRGTYLGLCQEGTVNSHGDATAFDYIRQLGSMSCNCSRFLIALNSTTMKARWPIIGATTFRIILHQKLAFQRIHPIRNKPWKSSKQWSGLIMRQEFLWSWMWSTIISIRPNMVPFQNTVPDYYYRMEPDGRFQNGTGVGNETVSEHEMYRKYMIDSPRIGSKSTRSMASALIWWVFTM